MPDIRVDRDRCIGSGVCIVYAPNTFGHDTEAKAVVLPESSDPPEAVAAALEGCPTVALHLRSNDEEQ